MLRIEAPVLSWVWRLNNPCADRTESARGRRRPVGQLHTLVGDAGARGEAERRCVGRAIGGSGEWAGGEGGTAPVGFSGELAGAPGGRTSPAGRNKDYCGDGGTGGC